MKVKLELLLTRTVTVDVVEHDLSDVSRLVKQLESANQETIHSMKIVEVNGRRVGTSLDGGSALESNKDQSMIKFRRFAPELLQQLRRNLNSKFGLFGSFGSFQHSV